MGIARHHRQPGIDVSVAAQRQQADQFVATFPVRLFALRRRELLIVHRRVVFIKPQDHRTFVSCLVRHKQITAVPHKNTRRIEKAIRLEDLLHGSVEPLHPLRRRHLLDKLAQEVLVAGGGALVIVFVIEPLALQQDFLGLRI